MPYDPIQARQLLAIVPAFAAHPTGEFIQNLATQLREAEAEIALARGAAAKAESDANRYAADLETAHATIRRLREAAEAPPPPPPAKPKRAKAVKPEAAT